MLYGSICYISNNFYKQHFKSYFLFVSIEYARPTLMTGELPDDFLRISGDTGTAVAQGQVQYPVFSGFQRAGGLLTITVVQVEWNVLVFSIFVITDLCEIA